MRELTVDALTVRVHDHVDALAADAADAAAAVIRDAIATRGAAHVMFASGNSQLAFLEVLVARPGIEWSVNSVPQQELLSAAMSSKLIKSSRGLV